MKLPPGYVPGVGVHKATAYGGYGEKLLKDMGWKQGQGLGVNGQGRSSAIKVHKKEDLRGVGERESGRGNGQRWWKHAYNSAVQTVKGSTSTAGSELSTDSESETSETPRLNRDGTLASGSKEEMLLVEQLARDPWGFSGGRNGKLARIRAQEAKAAAVLSGRESEQYKASTKDSQSKLAAISTANREAPTAIVSGISVFPSAARNHKRVFDESDQQPPKLTKRKKEKQKDGQKPGKLVAECGQEGKSAPTHQQCCDIEHPEALCSSEGATHPVIKLTPKEGWWGASKFVASGHLEGLEPPQQPPSCKQLAKFTEDCQAALYNATQAGKSSGKTGLGRNRDKGLNSQWKGTHKVFDGSELTEAPLPEPSKTADSCKRKTAATKVKWKQLCRQALSQRSSGQARISKLANEAALAAGLSAEQRPYNLAAVLLAKLKRSSKFQVDGKLVKLKLKSKQKPDVERTA